MNLVEIRSILMHCSLDFDISSDKPVFVDCNHEQLPAIFKDYQYPVSAWPVIINKQMRKELEQLSTVLPGLLAKIPDLYFGRDLENIANFYFGGDHLHTQFTLMCLDKRIRIGSRLDLTYTEEGFKVLEINMGSSIGGWQAQSFEPIIRKGHDALTTAQDNYRNINTQQVFMEFLVDQLENYIQNKVANIFVFMNDDKEDEELRTLSIDFFNDLYAKELKIRGLAGCAVTGDIAKLRLDKEGLFTEHGVLVSGIIVLGAATKSDFTPDMFRAFMMGKVYIPDNFATNMMGDKRNLALLREIAEAGKFRPEENELILKHIPWVLTIKEGGKCFYHGETYEIKEFLQSHKNTLVIKASRGMQGRDVFVGLYMDQQEWEQLVQFALSEEKFIAQELSESSDFLAPDKQNTWAPHKIIWGAFGFGNKYGGVWTRLSSSETKNGVINSATGAVESIVYECIN